MESFQNLVSGSSQWPQTNEVPLQIKKEGRLEHSRSSKDNLCSARESGQDYDSQDYWSRQDFSQHKRVITEVTKRCELIGLFQQMLKVSIINGKV